MVLQYKYPEYTCTWVQANVRDLLLFHNNQGRLIATTGKTTKLTDNNPIPQYRYVPIHDILHGCHGLPGC